MSLHLTQIRILLFTHLEMLYMCLKYLASLKVSYNRSTDAVKHVSLLVDTIMNSITLVMNMLMFLIKTSPFFLYGFFPCFRFIASLAPSHSETTLLQCLLTIFKVYAMNSGPLCMHLSYSYKVLT